MLWEELAELFQRWQPKLSCYVCQGACGFFIDFVGIHLSVPLHCVKFQSWERSYPEQAATLRKLHPQIGHFLEKVMARRLA